jgi:hypothetical protein
MESCSMSEHEAEVGDEDHNGKVTVKILRRTYDKLKARAISNRYNVVEYTNNLLCHALDKEEFAERYAPNLSLDEIEGNRATLKDTKKRQLIDVYFIDNELHCEADSGSTICMHVKYLWILPQVAKLLKDTGSKDTTNLERVSLVLPGIMSSIVIALTVLLSRFGEVSIL